MWHNIDKISSNGHEDICIHSFLGHHLWPWPLTQKPNEYVSCPPTIWPNFGEISGNSYECIVFTQFVGPLPAVTVTFDHKI